ncbi:MAG: BACON domain-containing protein [Deltaproteobacteria bacterium]|nr:BACON domain-containing protein [Deltaproteobacteria bacterium]
MRKVFAETCRLYLLKCREGGRSHVPLVSVLSALLLSWGGGVTSVHAQGLCQGPGYSNIQTFSFTGGQQTYAITSNKLIALVARGAQGAAGTGGLGSTPGAGGLGGEASGYLLVNNGDVLTLVVGGQASSATGGFNGGGNGGAPNPTHRGGGGGGAGGTSGTVGPLVLSSTTSPGVRAGDGEITVCDVPCVATLTPPNQIIGASGGAGNIATVATTASAACAWTASVSNAPWITITNGSAGTGNGAVTYSVAPNPGPNPRRGTMTIEGKTFIVTQATPVPAPCTITIPAGTTIGASAATNLSLVVTASTTGCARTAKSHVPWITITSGASGIGSGTVLYSVTANPGPNTRAGRITVNGKRFTVTQTP